MTYPPVPGWPVPAPARKRGLPGWAIALIVVGALVFLAVATGVALVIYNAEATPKPYVSVTGCRSNGTLTQMDYILTNKDSRAHSYTVHAMVGHYPAVPDTLANVAPGETASGHITAAGGGSCQITRVDQH